MCGDERDKLLLVRMKHFKTTFSMLLCYSFVGCIVLIMCRKKLAVDHHSIICFKVVADSRKLIFKLLIIRQLLMHDL